RRWKARRRACEPPRCAGRPSGRRPVWWPVFGRRVGSLRACLVGRRTRLAATPVPRGRAWPSTLAPPAAFPARGPREPASLLGRPVDRLLHGPRAPADLRVARPHERLLGAVEAPRSSVDGADGVALEPALAAVVRAATMLSQHARRALLISGRRRRRRAL